jgi:hypothetical protein
MLERDAHGDVLDEMGQIRFLDGDGFRLKPFIEGGRNFVPVTGLGGFLESVRRRVEGTKRVYNSSDDWRPGTNLRQGAYILLTRSTP